MQQTVCDRCNKIGGRATVSWRVVCGFSIIPEHKDLCKDCFKCLFPEWKL